MKSRALSILVLTTAWALLLLQGCSTPGRLKAVPAEETARAEIPDMHGVRYVLPDGVPLLLRDAEASFASELTTRAKLGETGPLPPASFLAVSGGGDNGAYGAGLLCGWTASGHRPEFKLVTGISTGALIAPFAFLGARYDDVLREFEHLLVDLDVRYLVEKVSLVAHLIRVAQERAH